jgi:enterochelin esterase-like enzyme
MDLATCTLDPERWARWLEHDPLNLVEANAEALRGLHCLYLDVGRRDQYRIQFGTRRLSALLEKSGIDHHFKEFDGTHSQMDWRLDTSLPRLAKALLDASNDIQATTEHQEDSAP